MLNSFIISDASVNANLINNFSSKFELELNFCKLNEAFARQLLHPMKKLNAPENFSDPLFKLLACNNIKILQTNLGSISLYELICLISVLDSKNGDDVTPNKTLQNR